MRRMPAILTLLLITTTLLAEDTSRHFTFRRAREKPGAYQQTPGVLAEALAGDLAEHDQVVFAVRADGRDGHYYGNFGYVITAPDQWKHGGKGGKLCVKNLRTGELRTLIDDPTGDVRDPAVSYDGRTILFSWRKGGTNSFLLYTIGVDGQNLTQLTDGPWQDMEPCWLPDGGIMFISSRCRRWVPCWYVQVATLYRCEADGSDITQISFGPETENTPWPMPDGRVMYTRWEYVDRGQLHYHGLWTINPDGSKVELLYDNMGTMNLYIDAKPIPNSDRIVTMISPLHGSREHRGRIGILDPSHGTDTEAGMTFLDRGFVPGKDFQDRKGKPGRWRDPYPVSSNCYLAANEHALMVINAAGDYEIVHELAGEVREDLNIHEPRLIRPRPREPVIPAIEPASDGMATFSVLDVTIGRNMGGIEPGRIKRLVVMEELPRPGANSMNPDAISFNGKNFLLHRILGQAPVDPDGSAHFKVPAGRAIFFYAIDADGLAAKAMPSWLQAVSGEQVSCVGCHEDESQAPPARMLRKTATALKRPPSRLEAIDGVPEIMDYVRDIQPIWDKHCIGCHNYDKHAGDLLLVGDMTPSWSVSYHEIKKDRTGRTWGTGGGLIGCDPGYEPDPYSTASGNSKLINTLRKGHKKVKLSEAEMERICRWADAGATFAGTYAALNSVTPRVRLNNIRLTDRRDDDYTRKCEPIAEAIRRRCGDCHRTKRKSVPMPLTGELPRHGHLFNLTRPDKSLILLAPLSTQAGGFGICKPSEDTPADAPHGPVFQSKDDPDYKLLRLWVDLIVARFDERKRWFEPGHVPPDWYLREMKRFEVLPQDYDPAGPGSLRGHEIDDRYFRMLYRMGPGPQDLP